MKRFAGLAMIALMALPVLSAIQDKTEPEHVTVQHILIAFRGSTPDPKVTRSQAEAEKLALQIFERAKAGEDFDAMVKTYTNDTYPGIYSMSNRDVTPDPAKREFPRARMVKAFGDVSFGLEVGGIGLAVFNPATSKFGWHIIKRLE
jgi:parvulin-like peptidyl-prolyl isomerase